MDEDDELYIHYLLANPLIGNQMLDWEQRLLKFLEPAIKGKKYLAQEDGPTDFNNLKLAARIGKMSSLIMPNDNKWLLKINEGINKRLYRKGNKS